jgi:hypothetical protein
MKPSFEANDVMRLAEGSKPALLHSITLSGPGYRNMHFRIGDLVTWHDEQSKIRLAVVLSISPSTRDDSMYVSLLIL